MVDGIPDPGTGGTGSSHRRRGAAQTAASALGAPGFFKTSCLEAECCATFWEGLAAPLADDVGCVSIYSRSDGIVDWRRVVYADDSLRADGIGHLTAKGERAYARFVVDETARICGL